MDSHDPWINRACAQDTVVQQTFRLQTSLLCMRDNCPSYMQSETTKTMETNRSHHCEHLLVCSIQSTRLQTFNVIKHKLQTIIHPRLACKFETSNLSPACRLRRISCTQSDHWLFDAVPLHAVGGRSATLSLSIVRMKFASSYGEKASKRIVACHFDPNTPPAFAQKPTCWALESGAV